MSDGLDPIALSAAHAPGSAGGGFLILSRLMADAEAQWSAGTFGAIAEFLRDPGEQAQVVLSPMHLSAATARGAVAIKAHPEMRLVPYETVSRHPGLWRHSIALCLPEQLCGMGGRHVLTELGPDEHAVREGDRAALLFDLGLGLSQTDACIRTADAGLIAALRAGEGRSLFEAGNGVMMDILHASPHRVFVSRLARVEVFQPIPQPDGTSPLGPHTHILPKLLRANRTHAATTPIPAGLVPCANVYPAHALLDAEGLSRPFDRARLDAFDALLAVYGDPQLVAAQSDVSRHVAAGEAPSSLGATPDKFARGAVRVALRKLKAAGLSSPTLSAWIAHFDRASDEDGEDETQHAC